MNPVNVICPHYGHEFIVEDYRLDDDEWCCEECGELMMEE